MNPLAQLDQFAPVLQGVLANIRPDQLDNPTPCAKFTVRGVLEHMNAGATVFAAAFRGEEPSGAVAAEPLEAVRASLEDLFVAMHQPGALDRVIAAPFGEVPGDVFARFVVLDGLVHAWDLSVATGQSIRPQDELVAEVETFARTSVDSLRDGETFAEAVAPPVTATPLERLAAFTGRKVSLWTRPGRAT